MQMALPLGTPIFPSKFPSSFPNVYNGRDLAARELEPVVYRYAA